MLGPRVRVTYINGIRTAEPDCRQHAELISDLFATPCYALWNKTAGAWADLSQATRQKLFAAETEEVLQLAQHLSQQLEAVGSNGVVVHVAHSQGALITALCSRHLSVAQRTRIHVIVLGGAASISDREYGSAINYYCSNEPMLYVDSRASRAWKIVGGGETPPTAASNKTPQHEPALRAAEALGGQRLPEGALGVTVQGARFVFLRPVHKGRFGIEDHLITNEAYLCALRHEAAVFRERYLWGYQRLRWAYSRILRTNPLLSGADSPTAAKAPSVTKPAASSAAGRGGASDSTQRGDKEGNGAGAPAHGKAAMQDSGSKPISQRGWTWKGYRLWGAGEEGRGADGRESAAVDGTVSKHSLQDAHVVRSVGGGGGGGGSETLRSEGGTPAGATSKAEGRGSSASAAAPAGAELRSRL